MPGKHCNQEQAARHQSWRWSMGVPRSGATALATAGLAGALAFAGTGVTSDMAAATSLAPLAKANEPTGNLVMERSGRDVSFTFSFSIPVNGIALNFYSGSIADKRIPANYGGTVLVPDVTSKWFDGSVGYCNFGGGVKSDLSCAVNNQPIPAHTHINGTIGFAQLGPKACAVGYGSPVNNFAQPVQTRSVCARAG